MPVLVLAGGKWIYKRFYDAPYCRRCGREQEKLWFGFKLVFVCRHCEDFDAWRRDSLVGNIALKVATLGVRRIISEEFYDCMLTTGSSFHDLHQQHQSCCRTGFESSQLKKSTPCFGGVQHKDLAYLLEFYLEFHRNLHDKWTRRQSPRSIERMWLHSGSWQSWWHGIGGHQKARKNTVGQWLIQRLILIKSSSSRQSLQKYEEWWRASDILKNMLILDKTRTLSMLGRYLRSWWLTSLHIAGWLTSIIHLVMTTYLEGSPY